MMIKYSAFLLVAVLVLFVAGVGFGEGEWENPEVVEVAEVSTSAIDEPEVTEPPRIDTFPVIAADEASIPRPRNPEHILEAVDSAQLIARLEADRQLLSEIRKDVPEAVEEAEMYLERLKALAELSDPERLVPLVNRVLDQAPIYFNWLEQEFETQEEQVTEYYVGGARGFSFAMENFRSAVFFVIMNRLDVALRVISVLDNQDSR